MFGKIKQKLGSALRRHQRRRLRGGFPGLRDNQIEHLMQLRNRVPLRDARVLEIAGDMELWFARGLRQLGAGQVVSTNITDGYEALPSYPGIERKWMDARSLDFPEQSFDLVVGVAILEHLHDLPVALQSICRILRPGGIAYLHGGPLWQGPKGHHVWVDGPSGRHYRFTGDNPLADWEHLYSNSDELAARLVADGCPQGDATAIVDWVYRDPSISRVPTAEIERNFREGPLELLASWQDRVPAPGAAAAERLAAAGAPLDDCQVASATFLARRPLAQV